MLLRDLIMGRENPWTELYDPSRKNLRAVLPFVRENLNVAAENSDWLRLGEVDGEREIEPGTGAVTRRGLSKVAVYRIRQTSFTNCPPFAVTLAASSLGTPSSRAGIVLATGLASRRMAKF